MLFASIVKTNGNRRRDEGIGWDIQCPKSRSVTISLRADNFLLSVQAGVKTPVAVLQKFSAWGRTQACERTTDMGLSSSITLFCMASKQSRFAH